MVTQTPELKDFTGQLLSSLGDGRNGAQELDSIESGMSETVGWNAKAAIKTARTYLQDQVVYAHTDQMKQFASKLDSQIQNSNLSPGAIRYGQRVLADIGGGNIDGRAESGGRNLLDALGEADDHWGSKNSADKKEFLNYFQGQLAQTDLSVAPAAAAASATPVANSPHVVVAKLGADELKQAGLDTDATGQLNTATQDKLQKLFALGQSGDAYKGKHDLIYGEKTHAALAEMAAKKQLNADELKTFHALAAMNGGDARQTARQLHATGYQHPDAATAEKEIAAARQRPNSGLEAIRQQAKANAAGEADAMKPVDASGLAGPQAMPLPSAGNRPNYAKVTLGTLAQNPAYQAATGHAPAGEKVKVSQKGDMTVTEVKGPHGADSIYGAGKDGTQIATTTKNGSVTSKAVVEANGQVASDQEMEKNAKGKQQLAQLPVTMPMPGAAPGAKPSNAPVLADNKGATQKQQSPAAKLPLLKV